MTAFKRRGLGDRRGLMCWVVLGFGVFVGGGGMIRSAARGRRVQNASLTRGIWGGKVRRGTPRPVRQVGRALAWARQEVTQSGVPYIQNAAINLRLAQLGLPLPEGFEDTESARLARPILARQRELSRRLSDRLCAADGRIQAFLDDYLAETGERPQLPRRTLVLDEPGLARDLSLPFDGDSFTSPLLSSYRLVNGVLHNPANDRRTTAGVFHIAEGGLPIPDDKIAVPKAAFARLLARAFEPPVMDMVLPYTANQAQPAACFVSLHLRPLVSPAVPGFVREKRMETRFIAPGGLVANLDFVEGIFGNGGDPYLPENDASLAPETWTGHTGCVILAPHLTRLTKKELGLPHVSQATDRQKRDGVCWEQRGRAVQRRARLQDLCPGHSRRDRDGDRRHLLRLLQEGGQDPDLLLGEPVRQRRGGARRRRAGLR